MATPSKRTLSPYGSARDLPSYQEMDRQIQGGKLLTRFIARNQRSEFLEIERQLNHVVAVVDRFYDRLGSLNWIFHELLPLSNIEAILDQTTTPEEAEQKLIEIYRETDKLAFWTLWLYGVEGLRERSRQIERAREHYFADQFDSATLHLIAVMDGFVNDFEPDRRRGLVSRDPDDMTAWDSVIGHHLGLTNALKAYHKTVKKRVDEEVYELHCHGIVHGAITQFGLTWLLPQKPGTCCSQLSTGRRLPRRAASRSLPRPRLGKYFDRWPQTGKSRRRIGAWKPSRLSVSDVSFKDHRDIHTNRSVPERLATECNFGALARLPSRSARQTGYNDRTNGWATSRGLRGLYLIRVSSDRGGEHCARFGYRVARRP